MKKLIVTVDVEGHRGKDPIKRLIWGNTLQGDFGIKKIIQDFGEQGIKVLFFVDFAEAWEYGEEKILEVVELIKKEGHDIGVHIHPDHMYDKDRTFLWQYDYDEQYQIIQKCTELYIKLVGKKPLSFRAGKYGANYDTLNILSSLGYKYDFSEYYGQEWCHIHPAITIVSPTKYNDITEFPVTMHQSFKLLKYKKYDKIDVEIMTTSELKYALRQVKKMDCDIVITLFLHSFSLLDWYSNPDSPRKNNKKIKRLKNAIKIISNDSDIMVINEEELSDVKVEDEGNQNLLISWPSNIKGLYYTYQKAVMIKSRNKKAFWFVWLVRIGILILVVVSILLVRGL